MIFLAALPVWDTQGNKTSLNEGTTHGNGLGVGRSANMVDLIPFSENVLKVYGDVSDNSYLSKSCLQP